MKLFKTTLVLALLLSGSTLTAGVPNTINYQSRITDAAGAPLPDGTITVTFQIYDAATGGTVLWNSGSQTVTTIDGFFSYDLGSNVVLPDLFGTDSIRYLGITVGTDPEISPRTRFTSAGYVFEAQKSDLAMDADSLGGQHPSFYLDWGNMTSIPAGFADGVDDEGIDQATADGRYVKETGDTMTGDLNLQMGGINQITLDANGRGIEFFQSASRGGDQTARLGGSSVGELQLWDDQNPAVNSVIMSATFNGGELELRDINGTNRIILRGNLPGDNSVFVPNDAINSNEILDEPGIVAQQMPSEVILTNTSMQDIKTVTITIPTNGYIVVNANITGYINTSIGRSYGISQIDETSGGTNIGGEDHWWGGPHLVTYQSVSHMRVYYKTAGTYTFRLEAMTSYTSGASPARISRCWIMATYYRTSYGGVTTVAGNPGDNPTAKAVSVTNPDGTVTTAYEMDLRYYEEKARAAKMAKQKAELAEAQAELELTRAQAKAEQK